LSHEKSFCRSGEVQLLSDSHEGSKMAEFNAKAAECIIAYTYHV
jgi:hypothetical protein